MRLRIVLLIVLAAGALMAEDAGYFLSMSQKGQLIWDGRMEDRDGVWYDVSIVPGYAPPVRYGWRNWKQAGGNLHDYFESKKYKRIKRHSGDALEWAFEDCLVDFAIKGSGEAWKDYFGSARERTKKRVFGWWLSYPWALMQSTVDNVFRIPCGLAGTVIGTGWGLVVVPGYHMLDSAVAATWNGGVEGAVLPAAGLAWNTVVAPPMALVGQKPSPERVDGFWISMVDAEAPRSTAPDKDSIAVVAEFGKRLHAELAPMDMERADQQKLEQQEIQALQQRSYSNQMLFAQSRKDKIQELINDDSLRPVLDRIVTDHWNYDRFRKHRGEIIKELVNSGLSEREAERAMHEIQAAPLNRYRRRAPAPKTDPVTESLEVIKNIE